MRLSKLVEKTVGAKLIWSEEEKEDKNICSLSSDSRKAQENGLYFCLTGEQYDGHNFVSEAIKHGAVAIVTEKQLAVKVPQIVVKDTREALGLMSATFYGNPTERMTIIGITGTNGKTTTSYMLASILEQQGKKTGVIGTLGVCYGNYKKCSELTTPDPIELQKTLAEMSLNGVQYVVMEVSAHALYYKKVAGIHFSACIFTNFTQDHLDFFHSMVKYKEAKEKLFLRDVSPIAILNGDDETGREFGQNREKLGGVKTLYYGLHTPSDAFAVITSESLYKTECLLNINDQLCRVALPMTGRHNVYNALAAATCALELGVSTDAVMNGLNKLSEVKGRLQHIGQYREGDVYVDFAHTPDGLAKSLDALRQHCRGKLICLFGCGGNRDKTKRPLMGETAARKSDFCILTSDNPRYEDPLDIISDIEKGYRRFSVKYVVIPNRKKALEYALDFLHKGDILLVAGKGGEEYQEIMGIKYVFDDQDIIERIIKNKGTFPLR